MSWGMVICPRILTLAGLGTVAKFFTRFPPFSDNKNKSDYLKKSTFYIGIGNSGNRDVGSKNFAGKAGGI
jgi:hypothetical protein